MAQIAARFARSVAEIHEKIPCKLHGNPLPTHFSAEFHDHYTQVTHLTAPPLARSRAAVSPQLFVRIQLSTVSTQEPGDPRHHPIGLAQDSTSFFLHLMILKKCLLMIDRNESKMTYPPAGFSRLYNTDMLFKKKSVPGIATVGVGAVSGKSTSSSSSAKRSREPSRNGTGQPPTAEF